MPTDGFFKWQVPHRILLKDEATFSFAGLWDEWNDKSTGEIRHTYAIITTEANDLVKQIHDCMPMILSPESEELWLNAHEALQELLSLLKPYAANEIKAFAVSPLVNSPHHNVPEVINSL